MVDISVDKLLRKIEEELKLAKGSTRKENLREKVYSIKILCELILDEKPGQQEAPAIPVTSYQPVITQTQPVFQQPVSLNQPKKIDMEDEANGDSLFDF
ncbi:YwdI family protein [Neobacillus niacini]|uniref:YwdI family protein n=1 Tax=Neobacillus niacini TaxID=86668 RepID=UPI003983B9D9